MRRAREFRPEARVCDRSDRFAKCLAIAIIHDNAGEWRADLTKLEGFGDWGKELRHLDYGGGRGLLSDLLREKGWRSESYDPFVDRSVSLQDLGPFDLVTAYEVFEHVPDVRRLVATSRPY